MELRKISNKIVALGMGIGLFGSTILGASAYTLSDYPKPFVDNGQLFGSIVVGDAAQPEDIVGAIDISAGLQYAMKKEVDLDVNNGGPMTIDVGAAISKIGNYLTPEKDSLYDVRDTGMTGDEFPAVLADGVIYLDGDADEKFTQTLRLVEDSGIVRYLFDTDDAPVADYYLWFDSSKNLYEYEVNMDSPVEFESGDDLEQATWTLQGQEYTITDVSLDSAGNITRMKMLAGDVALWLTQNHEITRTIGGVSHTIEVVDVSEQEDKCGISVDGTTVWIDENQAKKINDVEIGVLDAVAVHAQLQDADICELTLGAVEVIMKDDDELEINGNNIDDSNLRFVQAPYKFDGFFLTAQADEDIYLAKSENYVDPVFGNFEFVFKGISAKYENITFEGKGRKAVLEFVNNDKRQIELPLFEVNDSVKLGYNDESVLYAQGETCTVDCEKAYFMFTTSGNTAHLMTIEDIKDTELRVHDETYDKTYTWQFVDKKPTVADLGSLGKVNLTVDANAKKVSFNKIWLANDDAVETLNRGKISWSRQNGGVKLVFEESQEDYDDTVPGRLEWSVHYDLEDENIVVSAPGYFQGNVSKTLTYFDESEEQDESLWAATEYGSLINVDDADDENFAVKHPDAEAYANVFVAPVGASINAATIGSIKTVQLPRLDVGVGKLASEIANPKGENLISVGGPAVNKVSADLLGLSYPAYGNESKIPENKAVIKLIESGGKVAVLAMGWDAADTRRATRVLSRWDDYDLSGAEVVVIGTDLTHISISAPNLG